MGDRGGLLFAALLGGAIACNSSHDRYPPLRPGPPGAGQGGDDGLDAGDHDGPPPLDAAGLCGNQIHDVVTNAPNIYFVLDNSGSMLEPADPGGSGGNRYDAVRAGAVGVVRKLGPLINVGAALFPRSATDTDSCHVGGQVMQVRPGTPVDPTTGMDGYTTSLFAKTTQSKPAGGTPTSATLEKLTPTLQMLEGQTIVVLATDGAPNCNEQASCGADECMANLEGTCDPSVNCCAPNGPAGPASCVDRAETVAAIADIAALGIAVHVVGIPGTELYADVLDEMAVAGGASSSYIQVDDLSTLGDTFGAIASVVVSCTFTLNDPPSEPGNTNVYLDKQVLPEDPLNGWTWTSDSTIELHGEACDRLKNGKVGEVQIVSGCPTEQPK